MFSLLPGSLFDWTLGVEGLLTLPLADAVTGKLIIIAGQSNAVGQGVVLSADSGLDLPTAFTSVQLHTMWASTTGNPIVWTTVATGNLQKYAANGVPNMGVELSLGRVLFNGTGESPTSFPAFIGKMAISGSSLADHWLPTANYPTGTNLFTQFVQYINDRQTESGEQLGAIVWIHGEADAGDATDSAAYQANLTAFAEALRAQFGNSFVFALNQLNVSSSLTHKAAVRSAQAAFVAGEVNAVMVNGDDLPMYDGVHYNADNLVTLGYRFAHAIQDRLLPQSTAHVGATPSYLGADVTAQGSGSLVPRWGGASPYAAGDWGFLFVESSSTNVDPTLSDTQGFTLVGTIPASNFANAVYTRLAVYKCKATSASMPAPTVADSANNYQAAAIHIVRGADSTDAVDVVQTSKNDAFNTPVSLTGATTTGANRLVLAAVGSFFGGSPRTVSGWTNASLTNVTERRDSSFNIISDYCGIAVVTGEKATAGATGAITATVSGSAVWAGITIAVRP